MAHKEGIFSNLTEDLRIYFEPNKGNCGQNFYFRLNENCGNVDIGVFHLSSGSL